jgi:XTP/dITP diphosphohydrolase
VNEVVLASRNPGKLAEMQDLLAPLGWRLRPVSDFAGEAPDEPAPSYVENALLKARHACMVSGLPAIADDSGLEVAALDGAPGVLSARYSGEGDAGNNRKLLAALKQVPDERRSARFVAVIAYLRHPRDATPVIAQGTWRGTILHNPRGDRGFGYDPLFLVPEQRCSAAELEPQLKNRISHRGKAARHLFGMLHDAAQHPDAH